MLAYRAEIDGLRAIAVISVVFFHARITGFDGGYAGVDIFFVISGYLITSIIIAEKRAGIFSIAGFYERRARRILPALFFVVFACVPFAWMWALPAQLKEFSESLIAVSFFVSNFFFWGKSGYFSISAELKPLLHTWSLAVEEQFYVLFPLFFLMIWKFSPRTKVLILLAISFASLLFAQMGGNISFNSPFIDASPVWFHPTTYGSFFMPFGRIWELLLGTLVALYTPTPRTRTDWQAQTLSIVGAIGILVSFIFLERGTPYPSFYTLVPTVSTALILLFAGPYTLIGRLLGWRLLVGIGLISYSAYLWHQPLFAFARLRTLDTINEMHMVALTGLSLVLGYLSYRFIEKPFREKSRFKRAQIFQMAVGASVIAITLGAIGYLGDGFSQRLGEKNYQAIVPPKTDLSDCNWEHPLPGFPLITYCAFGSDQAENIAAVWGDSHADALFSELDLMLQGFFLKGLLIKNPYCGPIQGIYDRNGLTKDFAARCKASRQALDVVLENKTITRVIVAARWTYHLFPIQGLIGSQTFDNGEGGQERAGYTESYSLNTDGEFDQTAQSKARAIREFVEGMFRYGAPVILIYPVPEVGWHIPNRNHQDILFGSGLSQAITTEHERFKIRHKFVNDIFNSMLSSQLTKVRPEEILCDTYVKGRCVAQINGVPLYYDDDHLSGAGVRLLLERIAPYLDD